ncbi:ABC transporter ATP-binding protein [Salinisphaera aquimarina]|uniref:ABC transporter ATP-binding protein n=1 Tax=Salinisphaera aquimarina TaxID=2094031 RepID=A0ABV7ET51_9GAMM
MESDFKLSAQGLVRDYAGRRAVDNVNVTLAAGEVLGVLGPNGAGKSTTLRMLAGTLAPGAGHVVIAGQDMGRHPQQAKRRLGYLPERPPLYAELTVDEYLGFCARLHGIARRERRAAIAAAKQDCGLADTGRRLIGSLSKGYQQRVGIAQAIVHRPEVLILDEPTAGLDPNQLRGVRELITRLASAHSVIISSHILSEIQAVANRVMIIHQGRVVFDEPLGGTAAQADVLEIELASGPETAALAALDGVVAAHALSAGRWRLTVEAGRDIRVQLAETAARNDWQLVELTRRPPDLEERFAALTSRAPDAAGEPPTAGRAA